MMTKMTIINRHFQDSVKIDLWSCLPAFRRYIIICLQACLVFLPIAPIAPNFMSLALLPALLRTASWNSSKNWPQLSDTNDLSTLVQNRAGFHVISFFFIKKQKDVQHLKHLIEVATLEHVLLENGFLCLGCLEHLSCNERLTV